MVYVAISYLRISFPSSLFKSWCEGSHKMKLTHFSIKCKNKFLLLINYTAFHKYCTNIYSLCLKYIYSTLSLTVYSFLIHYPITSPKKIFPNSLTETLQPIRIIINYDREKELTYRETGIECFCNLFFKTFWKCSSRKKFSNIHWKNTLFRSALVYMLVLKARTLNDSLPD